LLDIDLPRCNGFEVLSYLKSKDSLRHIPVIMFTTSSAPVDVMKAYKGFANSYITKPARAVDYQRVVWGVEDFWLTHAQLPHLAR
jgi:CheY-like chemotaxis protein